MSSTDAPATGLPVPQSEHAAPADVVVRRLRLGYHLGHAVERIAAAAGKGSAGIDDLREAAWLIERYIDALESGEAGDAGLATPLATATPADP